MPAFQKDGGLLSKGRRPVPRTERRFDRCTSSRTKGRELAMRLGWENVSWGPLCSVIISHPIMWVTHTS